MSVIRINKTKDYTVMSNHHFRNKEMTLKAKGLLSMMLSLPDSWDYSIAGLVTLSADGESSVRTALQELEKFGYLKRTRTRKDGKLDDIIYDIFETPQCDFLNVENLKQENLILENQCQLNTKEINNLNNKNTKDKCTISKNIKIQKILDKKYLEYDIADNIIELLDKFFETLIENKCLVTTYKIESILSRLAPCDVTTQEKAINLSLSKGYKDIDPAWIVNSKQSKHGTFYNQESDTKKSETVGNYTF